ncbi:hypothetical protein FRC00_012821, partial [Tulasnella sp. 408]
MISIRAYAAILAILALSSHARWLVPERRGRAIIPRRFGQEQGNGIPAEIGQACAGEICGVLGGEAISKLLAGSPVCDQQDHADKIIDAARQQTDPAITANMIRLAVLFRQLEKNTPPDFTVNPPANRNSLFCQKAPKNPELNGLVQAQDPANDPNLFFDPATKTTVLLGAPGTSPFNGASTSDTTEDVVISAAASATTTTAAAAVTSAPAADATATAAAGAQKTVTVTVTVTVDPAGATATEAATTTSAAAAAETSAADNVEAEVPATSSSNLDFGSCTNPSIEFGPAFNGRALREFTFKPVDQTQFAQGEALNGNIVTNAVCNILKNNCKASDAANQACEAGKAAFAAAFNAQGSIAEKGAAADAFNLALGFQTNLAVVQSAPGGGPGNAAEQAKANFNKCSPPTIVFAAGIDGRTEESFVPENRQDFTQGSALNGNIVTRAVCDTLVNKCDANVVAINDCAAAQQATAGLSGQAFADAFNAA